MWGHRETYAIGGLEDVGYIGHEDRLVVLSVQGIGVIDCLTGTKVFRSEVEWWPLFNPNTGSLERIPGYWDRPVTVFGLHKEGGLRTARFGNWELSLSAPRPDDPPFEAYSVQHVLLQKSGSGTSLAIAKDGPCEFRAFGFSYTGRSLFAASSCELVIWSRD